MQVLNLECKYQKNSNHLPGTYFSCPVHLQFAVSHYKHLCDSEES